MGAQDMHQKTAEADFGCAVVGPCADLAEALELARTGEFDAALLDVNLGGKAIFPVADVLRERGLPYIFASGYGEAGIDASHRGSPVLQKPFRESDLGKALRGLGLR
jgi:CheY-like chemotaxis protein